MFLKLTAVYNGIIVPLNINNLNGIDILLQELKGLKEFQRSRDTCQKKRVGKMSAFVLTSNGFSLITRNKDTGQKLMSCNSVKSFEVWNAFSTTNFCVDYIFFIFGCND